MKRRQLISNRDAIPAKSQHKTPCTDCPWARTALPCWLGSLSAEEWALTAHSDAYIECHVFTGVECAGAAIYRANVIQRVRDPSRLTLPPDKVKVFGSKQEFLDHHTQDNLRRVMNRFRKESK